MTAAELYDLIDSLSSDIEFDYQGVHGAICPFNRSNIVIAYGDVEKEHSSIQASMSDRIYNGKCLNDIAGEIEID